jgi:hypothetical protein
MQMTLLKTVTEMLCKVKIFVRRLCYNILFLLCSSFHLLLHLKFYYYYYYYYYYY